VHRYFATGVGALITALMLASWYYARKRVAALSPWWSTATFVWVCLQGAFGALTVTMKLYPAIVTLHLLGGMVLLILLVAQHESFVDRRWSTGSPSRRAVGAVLGLVLVQIALGGWVSTNYAVLACRGFPDCNGQWWPAMDFAHAFTLLRELGRAGHGGLLPFEALVAIHMSHRLFALVAVAGLLWLLAQLWRAPQPAARRSAGWLAGLLLLQVGSGLSNVVLGWPLLAALLHSGGAAALVGLLTSVLARAAAPIPAAGAAIGRHLKSSPR